VDTSVTFRLALVGALIAGNAFFVIAEFALVRVRSTRLRELSAQGYGSADVALRLVGKLEDVLSAVQLGITMMSLGLGWVGEPAIAALFLPWLTPLLGEAGAGVAHGMAVGVAFAAITFLHVALGELVPKNVALARADEVSMIIARPMDVFMRVSFPAMRFINAAAAKMSRWLGATPQPEAMVHSPEEMKMLIAAGRDGGLLPADQEAMIRRVFDLDRVLVREVMVPAPDIVAIPVSISVDELLKLVTDTNYSRLPVYDGTPDKVIGQLSVKELLRVWALHRQTHSTVFPLRALLRPVIFVPETKPLNELLAEFRARHRPTALVVDEFGRITGLVTIEDILEAVVGEIEDEYDLEERPRLDAGATSLELDGATTLLDLENLYQVPLPRDRGFETLGGFTSWRLGKIPARGEGFAYQNWKFTVLEMDRRRVAKVRVERTA
jgi:CBS domain containing-hemolysin-like protein